MTAINPARLKVQTAAMGEAIGQADRFTAQLHELLAFYSARIRQTSLSRTPLKLQSYQVPEPVIQALESEIEERLEANPTAGYALADALWTEPWIEFRQVAIHVLGILPVNDPARILSRIATWLDQCPSDDIRYLIMTEGMTRLASEKPAQCFTYIEELISKGSKDSHQAALFGLELFARDPNFDNLPVLFRYLSKILQLDQDVLKKELSGLLRLLALRSEQETTYFLVKQLTLTPQPRIQRVSRQVMNDLSHANQERLREKLGKAIN